MVEAGDREIPRPIFWVVAGDTTYEILRHPDLMRMEHIKTWAEEYEYTDYYKVPVPIEERHPAWIEARNLYVYFCKAVIDGKRRNNTDGI